MQVSETLGKICEIIPKKIHRQSNHTQKNEDILSLNVIGKHIGSVWISHFFKNKIFKYNVTVIHNNSKNISSIQYIKYFKKNFIVKNFHIHCYNKIFQKYPKK